MSMWTFMRFEIATKRPLLTRNIGRQMTWEDMQDSTDKEVQYAFEHEYKEYLPIGSEGTAKYIKRNNREYLYGVGMSAYISLASGNLRDFHNHKPIHEWFKKKIASFGDNVIYARLVTDGFTKDEYLYDPHGVFKRYKENKAW